MILIIGRGERPQIRAVTVWMCVRVGEVEVQPVMLPLAKPPWNQVTLVRVETNR